MRVRGFADTTPCWAQLASSDPAAGAAFYCGLFGWESAEAVDGTTTLTLRGQPVAGLAPVAGPQPPAWLTWISTEDIEATVAAAAGAGGAVCQPVIRIGDQGQRAVLADPEGAVFAVWQRGRFRGAQVVSEPGAVSWTDLATRDMAAATAFYGKVFGWTSREGGLTTNVEYWEWSTSSRVVAGMVPMGEQFPAEVPAHWRTTFEVADCAAAVARCAELGGQVLMGPLDVLVGDYAQVRDPQGAPFGMIELRPEFRLTP